MLVSEEDKLVNKLLVLLQERKNKEDRRQKMDKPL
jgi:hypothetical protein